jgi:single-stranded-DNA-specific exonuclease
MSVTLRTRSAPPRAIWALEQAGVEPLLARLYAARGVRSADELEIGLSQLLPPDGLLGIPQAAALLADAITQGKRLLVVADYDCDGATACAVALRGLRLLGATPAQLAYFVPDRFTLGYGLTPEVAKLAAERAHFGRPDLLITVDNGIASVEGVAAAHALGMKVLVTDHHLPGPELPAATSIVNPNQPGCGFASKALPGVGVMFYVLLATRAELRRRGAFGEGKGPNLSELLDLVALGIVADVVPLDRNNRILVAQGLARIRARRMQPGLAALFQVAGRMPERAGSFDLGFTLGPRLNAAGRMADMALGIECLLTDDPGRALNIAQALDATNVERRAVEAGMRADAEALLAELDPGSQASLCLFDESWHQGVIGILAGRVKETHHRPTIAFAPGNTGELKGSGRSIPGLHLRDALDLLTKRAPHLVLRFGGHAMAAGLTIPAPALEEFRAAFEAVCRELIAPGALQRQVDTDGALESNQFTLGAARALQQAVWGQGFPPPLFLDEFAVVEQRVLKEKHLRLTLEKSGQRYAAIQFNRAEPLGRRAQIAFALDINEWNGEQSLQLRVEHALTLG